MSYFFKVPVISATQCNSEGMNSETIDMQNVSESRAIVHTVDFLAALMQSQDQREDGLISMRILKNRFGGQVGKICNFKMDSETLEVSDVTGNEDVEDVSMSPTLKNIMKNQGNISNDINSF